MGRKISTRKISVGILGCGAIGSRIAKATQKELKTLCRLSGVFDINPDSASRLAKGLKNPALVQKSRAQLIRNSDILVEAVNAGNTGQMIKEALQARRHVLAMSVGQVLKTRGLFELATKNGCSLLIPSGAIAGLDAIKSARMAKIKTVRLTTRKPVSGLQSAPYIQKHGIQLNRIRTEKVIFEGTVGQAVKDFPQNINVAAALALASQVPSSRLKIRIIASARATCNSHEIEAAGDFGRIVTRTENTICPDNPKTSYLAVLSGIQTLKEFCEGNRIGT